MSILFFGRMIYLTNIWKKSMANLIVLTLGNDKIVRCVDLDEATAKAISCYNADGRISVKITPEGGGPVTSLEFDRASRDWIATA